MKTRHVSKFIDVFQITCSWKKNIEIPGSHYFSFFALSNLLTQACWHYLQDSAAHFFWTCKMYIYYLLLHLFASLCPHTVIWCSQILNKTVFIVIFYCFCCQTSKLIWNSDWNATHWDYITSSPFQDVNLHKNPDLKSSCRLIKSNTHKIKTIAVLWFRLLLHVKLEKQHNIWFN